MDGFDPANSYGSVIVAVPDPDSLYQGFAAGLRKTYGKLPVAGIPCFNQEACYVDFPVIILYDKTKSYPTWHRFLQVTHAAIPKLSTPL